MTDGLPLRVYIVLEYDNCGPFGNVLRRIFGGVDRSHDILGPETPVVEPLAAVSRRFLPL